MDVGARCSGNGVGLTGTSKKIVEDGSAKVTTWATINSRHAGFAGPTLG